MDPGKLQARRLGKLFDLYPMELDTPKAATTAMREGLARAYADKEWRSFMENAVKFATHNLIRATTERQMITYQARIDVLMQILNMGKQNFIQFEMLKAAIAKREPLKDIEHQVEEIKL